MLLPKLNKSLKSATGCGAPAGAAPGLDGGAVFAAPGLDAGAAGAAPGLDAGAAGATPVSNSLVLDGGADAADPGGGTP